MSTVHVQFQEVKQSRPAIVQCPKCQKKRRLTVSKSYWRNGFHNERETRESHLAWINQKVAELERDGQICQSCEAEASGAPITKKIGPDLYAVYDRANPTVEIGRVIKRKWGRDRWELEGQTRTFPGSSTAYPLRKESLSEAAAEWLKIAKATESPCPEPDQGSVA